MAKFFLLVFFMLLLGVSILSAYSPEYVTSYVFFVVGIIAMAVVLKISLDFYLSNKEEGEEEAETFYDIEEYRSELKKRSKQNSR